MHIFHHFLLTFGSSIFLTFSLCIPNNRGQFQKYFQELDSTTEVVQYYGPRLDIIMQQ